MSYGRMAAPFPRGLVILTGNSYPQLAEDVSRLLDINAYNSGYRFVPAINNYYADYYYVLSGHHANQHIICFQESGR